MPATSAGIPRVSFFYSFLFLLLRPLTVLMKQTRWLKQSIFFRCLWGSLIEEEEQQTFWKKTSTFRHLQIQIWTNIETRNSRVQWRKSYRRGRTTDFSKKTHHADICRYNFRLSIEGKEFNGSIGEVLLNGKTQYSWPPCIN